MIFYNSIAGALRRVIACYRVGSFRSQASSPYRAGKSGEWQDAFFATGTFAFALAISRLTLHIEQAFQASSPKTLRADPCGRPFFYAQRVAHGPLFAAADVSYLVTEQEGRGARWPMRK
ncbi:hypothetical protein OSJ57_23830 [Sphingomonas sp. HH69]